MQRRKHSIYLSDIKRYINGEHYSAYEFLGSRLIEHNGKRGVAFCLYAPYAKEVRVVGNFNGWDGKEHKMLKVLDTGFWWLLIEGLHEGEMYKYEIIKSDGNKVLKADPYAFYSELRPNTASIVCDIDYNWNDNEWMLNRKSINYFESPMNIYEVHLGSWKMRDGEPLNYKECADELIPYLKEMGYTHIELLPIMEHPLDASWGYQITGYYAATSRYGKPQDFKYFVDRMHQNGIGVILDWVPGHFCRDEHGLYAFDGSHLYEHDDPRLGDNYDWGTANFDYGKKHVQSFLISNAMFWFEEFHIDGLRVDAVASMLYLNFGKPNLDIKNRFGGYENIDAVDFLKKLNKTIYENIDNPIMIAEESTTWPLVTYPTYEGGLGFSFKWNMGWMNDTLKYMNYDKFSRKNNHNLLTFSMMYAYSENFILPLSHDEVVHGKKSLIDKMSGDYEEKFKNLRLLYGYMMTHPGKKLLFMGGEIAQFIEWRFYSQIEWFLLKYPIHDALFRFVKELNHIYLENKSLWELDHKMEGFEWIDADNNHQSVISYIRYAKDKKDHIVVVINFSDGNYEQYKIGVPFETKYREILNSDKDIYGGSNFINSSSIKSVDDSWHGKDFSISIKLAPYSIILLKPEKE
ncbi:1,4-alpha-glucan branching enzyme GlgB [Caloramator mitchellensis]|uniref:1,4-alpha-glucan branching enzyme GlgB n=1 Tax=Caloramator mitchellensis TaxID=908809 RepID=A0A0R3K4T6_CALMK|nr:1,4-alpha-glucan branching protein GlgB [Caloramator mitchellensis]KRQ87375.1 1,4-alpha-glucan branching enzyme GlgB [Caloramator mitchellensis]